MWGGEPPLGGVRGCEGSRERGLGRVAVTLWGVGVLCAPPDVVPKGEAACWHAYREELWSGCLVGLVIKHRKPEEGTS